MTKRGSEMSFREKSAWISFVLILVIFGAYFWNASRVLGGQVDFQTGARVTVGLLIAFVVLEVVLHAAVALQAPDEARAPRDERERLIDMKSTRIAFPVLVIGALASAGLIHMTRSAWAVAQHVVLAVAVAELVKFGVQIFHYRRGV